ncbi:MAG: type II secretion system protein [Synergistaceae bacterium]|nr:type II secretion system protein [Synergistaceae bacterium]
MKSIKRKGFTLVELLIVIVVIGILAAMMMLSSTEAVSSARANNIISNLRNLKTAATAMYVDRLDSAGAMTDGLVASNATTATGSFDLVLSYLNTGGNDKTSYRGYGIKKCNNNEWYVYCEVSDTNVKKKLAARAASVGLCGDTATNTLKSSDVYVAESHAGMFVVKP